MKRARHQLSPLVPFQESVDRRFIYFMSDSLLKDVFDVGNRRYFSLFCQLKKRRQQFPFFLPCHVFMTSSSLSRSFHCCHSQPIVGGNHLMNSRDRKSTRLNSSHVE